MDEINNYVELCGHPAGRPKFSHRGKNEEYYAFPLEIERLSGNVDTLNVIARLPLLENVAIGENELLTVRGELRSFNNKSGKGSRLIITVFAREISFSGSEPCNTALLRGTLCKPPNLRRTPMGREICDLMLAVNRKYGRSDYLPCIAWGATAAEASRWAVGTTVHVAGRIQSRRYIKVQEGAEVDKTAYEVSVTAACKL